MFNVMRINIDMHNILARKNITVGPDKDLLLKSRKYAEEVV